MKFLLIIPFFLLSCSDQQDVAEVKNQYWDLFRKKKTATDTAVTETVTNPVRKTTRKGNVGNYNQRKELVKFAYRYLGTPYVYAAADPKTGFDCSGFIYYVYRHFGFEVPRSSKDFLDFGQEIPVDKVRTGDLLIFYGTDVQTPEVGHIGIVSRAAGSQSDFIHASSGKANGVTVSSLSSPHYTARFVKAITIINTTEK
ncbi:MAG: C40 family peptidase [Flavobacteriia bacterium]|nr:C40 family peptidase [Flavobacteriia bacterium]MBH2023061.1 C40 family peptidase [Flavobacteriales bacterium]